MDCPQNEDLRSKNGLNNKSSFDNKDVSWLISEIPQMIDKEIVIPEVQRGLVWNAVRTEVLWDSIMRGIPIGVLTVRNNEAGKYELFDGQQRVNAIALGYKSYFESKKDEEREDSILWLDLCPPNNLKNDRKFFFMITTLSQPWGYGISNDERNNARLLTEEKKAAIDKIKWERSSNSVRPYPYELFPIKAAQPVPFSILRFFLSCNREATFDDFLQHCEIYNDYNWKKHLNVSLRNDSHWNLIKESIRNLNRMSIVAHNISIIGDDIGIYFQRMNKSGYTPDDEEIRYSRLKAKLPSLKHLDSIAKGRMKPSRLAHISIIVYKSDKKDEKNKCTVSNADIISLSTEEEFSSFIKCQMGELIEKLERLILYRYNKNGLPKVVYASLPQKPILYALILLIVKKKVFFSEDETKELIGFCTFLLWFRVKDGVYNDAYNFFLDREFNLNTIKECIFTLISNSLLEIPAIISIKTDSEQESICNINELSQFFRSSNIGDQVWKWTRNEAREILLYAGREYIEDVFGSYSPWNGSWDEENRPWDYDHIFPKSWLKGSYQGEYHSLSDSLINSIGNIAPIPLSNNRSKNDTPPGEYLKTDNARLFLPPDFNHYVRYDVENDENHVRIISRFILSRFECIYGQWFDTLSIGSLLDFNISKDERYILFDEIKRRIPDASVFYTHNNGYQYNVKSNVDWARPWLTIGIDCGEDKGVFPAIAFGKINPTLFQVEVGLRRHPKRTNIDGNSLWYKENPFIDRIVQGEVAKKTDELCSKLKKLSEEFC